MDKFVGFEFDRFGFSIDSADVYVSISWGALAIAAIVAIAYRIYKKRFSKI